MEVVETPVQVIKTSIHMFVFAYFLKNSAQHELITPASFREQIRLDEGRRGLRLKASFDRVKLNRYTHNIITMTIGTTAMATNKALEIVYGKINPADTSPEGSARVLLYQIRCAFAHDPLIPVWNPKVDKYNHTYRVTIKAKGASIESVFGHEIEFHPPSLKNRLLSPDHIGGVSGYMGLLHYFLAQVKAHPKGNQPYPCSPDEQDSDADGH